MFKVILGIERNGQVRDWWCEIEGCPRSGIKAIDFRRGHGLPEAPDNLVFLKGLSWQDEEFVRSHPERADGNADIVTEYRGGRVEEFLVNASHEVYQDKGRALRSERDSYSSTPEHAVASPKAIRAYLQDPCPRTASELLLDYWDYANRSQLAADKEVQAYRDEQVALEAQKREARLLLKDEIDALEKRAKAAEDKAAYWEKEHDKMVEEANQEEEQEA